MFTREERMDVARYLLSQLTPQWSQNPRLRDDLKTFVETGSMESLQDGRIMALLQELQRQPPTIDRHAYIRQLLNHYGIPTVTVSPQIDSPQRRMIPQERRGIFSAIPEGCLIPLTFIAFIGFMGIVLLVGFVILAIVSPDFAQSTFGSAFSATLVILTIGTSVIFWMRRQASSPLQLLQLAPVLAVVGVIIFGMFQTGLIDIDAFTEGTLEDQQRIIGSGLLMLGVGVAVFLWVRRQVMNIIWTIILLAIIIGALIFAVYSGIIDLDSLISNANSTFLTLS